MQSDEVQIGAQPLEHHGLSLPRLALPDHGHREAQRLQPVDDLSVALSVAIELLLPVARVALGRRARLAPVAMPEAAVHENGPALASVRDVG
jgi:hypothetical protein